MTRFILVMTVCLTLWVGTSLGADEQVIQQVSANGALNSSPLHSQKSLKGTMDQKGPCYQ